MNVHVIQMIQTLVLIIKKKLVLFQILLPVSVAIFLVKVKLVNEQVCFSKLEAKYDQSARSQD